MSIERLLNLVNGQVVHVLCSITALHRPVVQGAMAGARKMLRNSVVMPPTPARVPTNGHYPDCYVSHTAG